MMDRSSSTDMLFLEPDDIFDETEATSDEPHTEGKSARTPKTKAGSSATA